MKTERNILIAFILNFAFSIFEFFGGIITGSIAIISDAVHDLGDAASIGVSYFLEKKSKGEPDENYTFGYVRYSVVGGLITTMILIIGSVITIYGAIHRIITPTEINYTGMIVFAIIGVLVNLCAAFFTHGGESINQKAVNLHMLEDVFGWIIVLIGAVIIRFTDIVLIDPVMSIGVSAFIFVNAIRNLREIIDLFLEKTPQNVCISEIQKHICKIPGIQDVHHVHIWSIDGYNHYATMHVVTDLEAHEMKEKIREELLEHHIGHVTIEIESSEEHCHERECQYLQDTHPCHCHHHHHYHH